MAAKSQNEAKETAKKIAEAAKSARTKKSDAKKEIQPEAKVEEVKGSEIQEPVISEDERLSEANNTADDKKQAITKESAKAFQDESDMMDQFLRRTVHLPSRRAIKEAFTDEEVIGDEFDEIESEGAKRALEYQQLSDSAKAKRPKRLLGRVTGIEPLYDSENRLYSYEAKVSFIMNPQDPEIKSLIKKNEEPKSIYSIYIPAPVFFFQRKPELFEGPEGLKNLYRAMKNKTNALIDFVVYDISADDKRVIGSRIRAMQLKAYEYYLDPRNTRQIKPGKVAAARITEVGVLGVTVDICGAETFIPNDDLSWLHINNAKDIYKVGQTIKAVVKTVELGKIELAGKPNPYVAITASAKEATKKPLEAHGDEYKLMGVYPGKVVYRLPSGKYIVRLDDRIEVICYPPKFGTPRIGEDCSVFVKDKNEVGFVGDFTYIE